MTVPIPAGQPVRWAIAGAGRVATAVATDIVTTQGNVLASVSTKSPCEAVVVGTEGWMVLRSGFPRPGELLVHTADGVQAHHDPLPDSSPGYGPQIAEVARCLRGGLVQSPLVPQDETIAVMRLLDQARSELGVFYPGE